MPPRTTMSDWIEQLQSRGRYTFTRKDAESETGRSFIATQTALRRLKEKGKIVAPRRGFYVIVPPEYRATGAPPASWFIDALMRHLDQPYYVGVLSAATLHGASHQQPMIFQVVTSKPTREVRVGKVTIRFSTSRKVEPMPTTIMQTETGTMRVATSETAAFDLVRYPLAAGQLQNMATVLGEMAERIDGRELVEVANLVKLPDVQRLGYLLEAVGARDLAAPMADWLEIQRPRVVPLLSGGPAQGEINQRWRIHINAELDLEA
ncbi:hypothetical protein GF314_02710 [bacterium]|nr:hypothetical protein [bacterium]